MGKKKNKSSVIKKYSTWNHIKDKPENAVCVAYPGDIVMKINQVWFLCQRDKDVNNIVCFRQPGKWKSTLDSIRAMFEFCYRLRRFYGIEYIRVSGKKDRYAFIDRLFPEDSVKENNGECNEYGEIVRYVHLSDRVMRKLEILRKNGRA